MNKQFENFNRELIPEKLTDEEAEEIIDDINDNRLTLDKEHSEYFNIDIDKEKNRGYKILRRKHILEEGEKIKIKDYLIQLLKNLDKKRDNL